jgi:hypothetical protein
MCVIFQKEHGLLLSTSPVYVTRFHRKSGCRLCFTWTCVLDGKQEDMRLVLLEQTARSCYGIGRSFFVYLRGCWFFKYDSTGGGVQIIYLFVFYWMMLSGPLYTCSIVSDGWFGIVSWQGCGHWHFVEGERKIIEKLRIVRVPLCVQTGPLSDIFGKSSKKQIGPSSSLSEYKTEVVLLGPTCFLLDF